MGYKGTIKYALKYESVGALYFKLKIAFCSNEVTSLPVDRHVYALITQNLEQRREVTDQTFKKKGPKG